jgi:hypothetical protein
MTDHTLDQKTHTNEYKRTEITQGMLSDHSGIKLEINSRKINSFGKPSKYLEIKQHALKHCVKEASIAV